MRGWRILLVFVWLIAASSIQAQDSPSDANPVAQISALQVVSGPLDAVTFSPDGALIASGGRDHNVRLWDTATGENAVILEGHNGWVASVVFNHDGSLLASGGYDDRVFLWDVASDSLLYAITAHDEAVTSLAFTHDDTILASGSRDGTIRLTAVAQDMSVATLENFGGPVWDIAFSPDDAIMASASEDGTIWLWGLWNEHDVWIKPLRGHVGPVIKLAFSPDGTALLSGGQDGTVRLWDISDLSDVEAIEPVVMRGHLAAVMGVGYTPDAEVAISASLDGTVRLWDVSGAIETGKELATIVGKDAAPLTNLTLSPDHTIAASVGTDGVMRLWDVGEDAIHTLIESKRPVTVVRQDIGSDVLVSTSSTRTEPSANPSPRLQPTSIPETAPVPASSGPVISIPAAHIQSGITTFYMDGVSWAIDPWEPRVGHLQGTAWFNNVGNVVLAAHSEYPDGKPGIFAGLYNVQIGNEIVVVEGGVERRYIVVDKRTVRYDDLSVVYPTSTNRLTLITCDIPSFQPQANFYAERLIIVADAAG